MNTQGPTVFVSGRQGGKTTALIEWFMLGFRTAGYPGWSRVMLAASTERCWSFMRRIERHWEFHTLQSADPNIRSILRHSIMVATPESLRGLGDVEIGVDDTEDVLRLMLGTRNPISFVTMTGELYSPRQVPSGLG